MRRRTRRLLMADRWLDFDHQPLWFRTLAPLTLIAALCALSTTALYVLLKP